MAVIMDHGFSPSVPLNMHNAAREVESSDLLNAQRRGTHLGPSLTSGFWMNQLNSQNAVFL